MEWKTLDGTRGKDEYKGTTLVWDPVEGRWAEVHHIERKVQPPKAAEHVEIPLNIFPKKDDQ